MKTVVRPATPKLGRLERLNDATSLLAETLQRSCAENCIHVELEIHSAITVEEVEVQPFHSSCYKWVPIRIMVRDFRGVEEGHS